MRRAPSDAERTLWNVIRNRHLDGLKFRRQVPVGPYIAGYLCDELRLILEVDGDQHADAVEYDRRRTDVRQQLGWRVLRFTARDVVQDLDAMLLSILRDAMPSP